MKILFLALLLFPVFVHAQEDRTSIKVTQNAPCPSSQYHRDHSLEEKGICRNVARYKKYFGDFKVGKKAACPLVGFHRSSADLGKEAKCLSYDSAWIMKLEVDTNTGCPEGYFRNTKMSYTAYCYNLKFMDKYRAIEVSSEVACPGNFFRNHASLEKSANCYNLSEYRKLSVDEETKCPKNFHRDAAAGTWSGEFTCRIDSYPVAKNIACGDDRYYRTSSNMNVAARCRLNEDLVASKEEAPTNESHKALMQKMDAEFDKMEEAPPAKVESTAVEMGGNPL